MDLINDIKNILINRRDTNHDIEINVRWDGVSVNLRDESNYTIPVFYDITYGCSYIPNDELRNMFNPSEGGIELDEIKIIHDIMEYFEKYSHKIYNICKYLSSDERLEIIDESGENCGDKLLHDDER